MPNASVAELARVGAIVGLDVRIRAYPGGDPVRDAGQIRLIERFRSRLHPTISVRLEVPLSIVGDRRAWDLVLGNLFDAGGVQHEMPTEVETRIVDTQAQLRRLTLKMRDAGVDVVLLVVADTPSNRRAITANRPIMSAMFPVSPRVALAALAEARHPGGSSLVFI